MPSAAGTATTPSCRVLPIHLPVIPSLVAPRLGSPSLVPAGASTPLRPGARRAFHSPKGHEMNRHLPTAAGWPYAVARRTRRRALRLARRLRLTADAGMTTAEYAVGTIAACTFAALLIAVIKAPGVKTALSNVITSALGIR